MRILLSMDSTGLAYFPGLAQAVEIDSKKLPADEAKELKRLVDEANFFEQPPAAASGTRSLADAQQYNLTIVDGRRRRTLTLSDPIEDPALQALLAEVQCRVNEKRDAPRPTKRGKGNGARDE